MTKQSILYGLSQAHITMLNSHVGIHKEMLSDYINMVEAANKDGIEISIVSGFRNFDRQLSIWNRKASGQLPVYDLQQQTVKMSELSNEQKLTSILLYSALPGTSRHHWGTDIDVYSPSSLAENQKLQLQPWEYEQGGPFAKLSNWLAKNAKTFGFFLPYDSYRGGVAAEPWHLSYFPVSQQLQEQFDTSTLIKIISSYPIALKHEIIKNIDEIVERFVTNIGGY